MKPIRLVVVRSTTRPDMLSIRVNPRDATATAFYRALTASGAKVGDVLEVRLAAIPGPVTEAKEGM